MEKIILSRKYRPKKISDVVGQNFIVKTIKNAFESDKLAHAYLLIGDIDKSEKYKKKAEEIIRSSKYWQMRIASFPQILKLAGFNNQDDLIKYLGLKIPSKLVPDKYQNIFDKINARREAKRWRD